MSLKTLFTLIVPGALTLVGAGLLLLYVPGSPVLTQAARGYPLVALAVAMLLAWRMHRSRLLLIAMLLLGLHAALHPTALGDDVAPRALAAVLLPLLAAALALSADRNLATRYVLLQAMLILLPAGAAIAVLTVAPADTARVLTLELVDPLYTDWMRLPQIPMIAAFLGLGTLTLIALLREKPADAGLGWATLAGVLAIAAPAGSTARGIWLLAAGLILIIALVESSYIMAFHDELTGLPARRALAQTLAALRPPYTVAIVDVDNFKSFNDRYGHDVGDQVLRMVATRLGAVTGGGRAYRSGGEEFTIVFPGRTKAEVLPHIEQVREAVAEEKFAVRRKPRPSKTEGERKRGSRTNEKRLGVTISVGLAGVDARNPTPDMVIKAADKAMYRAKQGGRNRVVA
ncbi:MAG TPA: GGDEF domain-containing protein [Longimicrobiales bacterium]